MKSTEKEEGEGSGLKSCEDWPGGLEVEEVDEAALVIVRRAVRELQTCGVPVGRDTVLAAQLWGIGPLSRAYEKYGKVWLDTVPEELQSRIRADLLEFAKQDLEDGGIETPLV